MSVISELRDDQILDFLMTSELEDLYKLEELKYLIIKFRFFYRIIHSKRELIKSEKDGEIFQLKNEIKSLNSTIGNLMSNSDKKDFLIQNLKNRKLSLKERISGKIITKDNENK